MYDFCFDCGRLGHLRCDCKWGKHLNYGKSYGKWMLAESVHVKSNKVLDLLFMDVIDAHLEEGRKASIKDQTIEEEPTVVASEYHEQGERVELLVSNAEADRLLRRVMMVPELTEHATQDGTGAVLEDEVLVQSEPAATTNLNLDLPALDKSLEMTIEKGKVSEASPQLVIQLGPCGPLENQIVPMSLSLSQARFLSWATIMHSKDSLKPNIVPFFGEIRDISEESPMVVDRGKGKRSFEEKVETEGKLNKKMKLEPVGKFKQVAKTSPIRKITESKRVRELKKIARDKEGRKKMAMFTNGSISPISTPTDNEAEEAGLTMPHPESC